MRESERIREKERVRGTKIERRYMIYICTYKEREWMRKKKRENAYVVESERERVERTYQILRVGETPFKKI